MRIYMTCDGLTFRERSDVFKVGDFNGFLRIKEKHSLRTFEYIIIYLSIDNILKTYIYILTVKL